MTELTTIQPDHLEDYTVEYYDTERLEDLSEGELFEAFCEVLVEENPHYELEQLAETWASVEMGKREFAEKKFIAATSEDVRALLGAEGRESWIGSTATGIAEYLTLYRDAEIDCPADE